MEQLAAAQSGYLGFVAVRGADGTGIAVSYWRDEADAAAWRDQPGDARIRDLGRAIWYDAHALTVSRVTSCYDWQRQGV